MSDSRGPEFLPYAMPTWPTSSEVSSPRLPAPSTQDRMTPWAVAAVTAGVVALLSAVVVSLLAGHRGAGAVLATMAAAVAVGAGLRALRDPQPEPGKALVTGGMSAGVGSAVVALLLLLTHHSAVTEQPPVQVPSPAPSVTSTPQPQPSPSLAAPSPAPSPSVGVLPPGSNDLFGIPTGPGGPPVIQDLTAKGTLTGRVVSTSGTPIQGAVVTMTRADPKDTSDSPPCPLLQRATTDVRGRYTVQLCQLGDGLGYTVTITSAGAQAHQDLFVNSGQITVYNVILAVRRA